MNSSLDASVLDILLENAPYAVSLLRRSDRTIIYANPAFERYTRCASGSIIGHTVEEIFSKDKFEISRFIDSLHETGETKAGGSLGEFATVLDSSGIPAEVCIRYTLKPVKLTGTDICDFILVYGEETASRTLPRMYSANSASSSSLELTELGTVIKNLDEGVAILSSKGAFTVVNPAFYRIHGFTEREIAEDRADMSAIVERLSVFDLEGNGILPADKPLSRIFREEFKGVQLRVFRSDSGRTWIGEYSGTRICDANGNMVLGIIFLRDITKEKESEMRMNQLLKSKDMFLSMASHEIKTPLTVLSASLQVLSLHFSQMDPENRMSLMEKTIVQCKKLNRLVDDLLDISRLATGHLRIRTAPEDIGSIVETVTLEQKKACTTHEIELRNIIHKTVSCDSVRMDQVLSNLIVNAIKYSPPGTKIEISMVLDGNWIEISVRDFGIGIDARDLPYIFDQYYRSTGGQSEPTGGMGLGLFISKEIVRLHGGDIRVVSERGMGSTFTLRLMYYN